MSAARIQEARRNHGALADTYAIAGEERRKAWWSSFEPQVKEDLKWIFIDRPELIPEDISSYIESAQRSDEKQATAMLRDQDVKAVLKVHGIDWDYFAAERAMGNVQKATKAGQQWEIKPKHLKKWIAGQDGASCDRIGLQDARLLIERDGQDFKEFRAAMIEGAIPTATRSGASWSVARVEVNAWIASCNQADVIVQEVCDDAVRSVKAERVHNQKKENVDLMLVDALKIIASLVAIGFFVAMTAGN